MLAILFRPFGFLPPKDFYYTVGSLLLIGKTISLGYRLDPKFTIFGKDDTRSLQYIRLA
jgi:hypothetical protein